MLLDKIQVPEVIEDDFYFEIKNKDGVTVYSYYENSVGYWVKETFNAQGKRVYVENSNGFKSITEYDSNGDRVKMTVNFK